MQIRVATPNDTPAIGEVDPLVRGTDLTRGTLVEDAVHGRRDSLCLVATTGSGPGRLVGYTVLRRGHFFGHDFVDLLVVAPAARRQGIGSALLAAAVRTSVGPQVFTSTRCSDLAMRALLAAQGWQPAGRLTGLAPDDDELVVRTAAGPVGGPAAAGPSRLFHIALRDDWDRARRAGEYRTSTLGARLDEVGFVHASFGRQVAGVATGVFAGVEEPLVLLVIDRARLRAPVRVEPADGTDEVFPHVYGPIPVDAVAEAIELHRDAAGRLALPRTVTGGPGR